MIGISALLISLGFVLFPLLAGWAIYLDWHSRRAKHNLLFLAFISLFFLVCANRLLHNLAYHHELRTMSASEVSGFEVEGKVISNPRDISHVVSALNGATWFSYNHGGAARRVPMTVHFVAGGRSDYHVGYYIREEGAVIEFSQRWGDGVVVFYGEAFCRGLPKALEDAGVPLPKD